MILLNKYSWDILGLGTYGNMGHFKKRDMGHFKKRDMGHFGDLGLLGTWEIAGTWDLWDIPIIHHIRELY